MANTASAKKEIRSQARKQAKNLQHRRDFRRARKDVQSAIKGGDAKAVEVSLSKFYKEVDKAAKVKAIPANTASRYKSRLSKQALTK
jgi:ribosomal protein S20